MAATNSSKGHEILMSPLNNVIPIKKISKAILILFGLILFLFLILTIIGGGLGKKEFMQPAILSKNLFFFAHRGAVVNTCENCMASFSKAKRKKFPGVEMDIQESSDGHFFIFHDSLGTRLLGKTFKVSSKTLREIKKYDLISEMNKKEVGLDKVKAPMEKIPSLAEFANTFKADFVVYLDMKLTGSKSIFTAANKIAQFIKKYMDLERTLVASADYFFIGYLEYNYPEINTVLEGFNAGKEILYHLTPKKFRPDYLSSFQQNVDKEHILWLKKNNLLERRIVYGVDEKNFTRIKNLGISKFIVDYGEFLDMELLRGSKKKLLN